MNSWLWIGFANSNFKQLDYFSGDEAVGFCANSYSFNPFASIVWHSRNAKEWGIECDRSTSSNGTVISAAVDMQQGRILFAVDGNWNQPCGIAFNNLNTDIPHFPALT
jgi:hypothetical protein